MIGLADCNNFFVSCERSINPQLCGKAVIVASNNDGCAVARSNEAKALGVKMGQPVHELRDLINSKQLIVLSGNHLLYHDISRKVHAIFRKYVPVTEDYSIDEAFLDVDGIPVADVIEIAKNIVYECMSQEKIPVTIGFSLTKTLAKVASHKGKKEDNRVVLLNDLEEIKSILKELRINEVWGIGRRLCRMLYLEGIRTASDFIDRDLYWIQRNMGVNGVRVWNELQGIVCSKVNSNNHSFQASISETRTFPNDTCDYDYLRANISVYASHCAARLRKAKGVCSSITVFLCTNRFRANQEYEMPSVELNFDVPVSSSNDIVDAAIKGLNIIFDNNKKYKRGGVIISKIRPQVMLQPSLFDFENQTHSSDVLMDVIDQINQSTYTPVIRLASQISAHIRLNSKNGEGFSSSFGYNETL